MEAIGKYRYPFRVRTDYGGENIEVWRDMVAKWGEDSGFVVVGSSVHNQRIEHHNRSVNNQVIYSWVQTTVLPDGSRRNSGSF